MRLTKEVRVGAMVSIAMVILFTGFYLLKGADIFSNDNEYNCYYTNIDGLVSASTVQLKGLNVGHIVKMELAGTRGVKVTITLSKKIAIPEGTTATITSLDILGSKIIRLDLGQGPSLVKNGEDLPTANAGGLVDNVTNELSPRLKELKTTIIELDTALAGINNVLGAQNQKAISIALQSITTTANNLSHLSASLEQETGEIGSILHNANSVTANLAKNNDTVKQILANVNNLSRQLANAPIQKTLSDLENASSGLQGVVNKINSGEGSLGQLITNKDMYNNLNNSINSIHSLTDDIKAHPSRYINVSVFGKKSN